MTPKYFDIHSHLNASQYDSDREEVIARMKETGTHTIVVGTSLEDSIKGVDLAGRHLGIYATIGVHPVDDVSEKFNEKEFEKLVKHPKVVMVGECGLDFFHADKTQDFERQKKLFVDQITFAIKYDKPLMIHARSTPGTNDAYEEVLNILTTYYLLPTSNLRGNVHFFAGSVDIAKKFFDLGFSLSFTGVITFTHDYDEVIRNAPLDKIMSETDAPYVSPVPHRGESNEPSFVSEVVKKIAEIRGESEESVKSALVNNALTMIG
jgi:TatD DNase family protein